MEGGRQFNICNVSITGIYLNLLKNLQSKPALLIVGDYNRKDFLELFKPCKNDFTFYFIEYASAKEVNTSFYTEYGEQIFWKDYKDAFTLLEKIKPAKVIFFFIESFNHVALNVACKQTGIPTYHLEHGLRDYEYTELRYAELKEREANNEGIKTDKKSALFKNFLKTLPVAITKVKNRLFYIRTSKKVSKEARDFLELYYKVRSTNNIFDTFNQINSPLRVADEYISFSPEIFKFHQRLDHLPIDQKVHFIGTPGFDKLAVLKPSSVCVKGVLIIDQPLAKYNLLGWTRSFQEQFVSELIEVCGKVGYPLFVKMHPLDDTDVWKNAARENKVEIINDEEFHELAVSVNAVLGFNSTLLMPLAAMPHTTVITFENHPLKDLQPLKFLVGSGVSTPIYSLKELPGILNNIDQIHQKQLVNKTRFIGDWLFKFDGRAGERLREVLLRNN